MSRLALIVRNSIRNTAVRRIVIVVLLVVAYQGWLSVQALGKVGSEVGEDPNARGRFAVSVVLDFKPQRFHILELQKHGLIRGTDGTVVQLRAVSPAGADALARYYWIEAIKAPQT